MAGYLLYEQKVFFVRSIRLLTTPSLSNSINKQQTPLKLGTLAKDFSSSSCCADIFLEGIGLSIHGKCLDHWLYQK